jgi:hypothetical protein
MVKSSRHRVFVTIVLVLVGVALLIGICHPATSYIHWVGSKDLKITFLALDADSEEPVKDAKVDVLYEETNLCSNRQKVPFSLVGDDDGVVSHLNKECMCFGTEGGWGPTRKDTFAIHIPGWRVVVGAPGYLSSEAFYLDTAENQHRIVRGDKTATLEIVVKLQKAGHP